MRTLGGVRSFALKNCLWVFFAMIALGGSLANQSLAIEGPGGPGGPPEIAGALSGTVTNSETGDPIAESRVIAHLVDSNFSLSVLTDDQGYYLFDAVPAGDYNLVARKQGFIPSEGTAAVEEGEEAQANFELEPIELPVTGLFSGQVCNDVTSPVAYAWISIHPVEPDPAGNTSEENNEGTEGPGNGNPGNPFHTFSDQEGFFDFGPVPVGLYEIQIRKEHYRPLDEIIEISEFSPTFVQKFTLLSGDPTNPGAIAGKVLDRETSAPIAGAVVFYAPFHHSDVPEWWLEDEDDLTSPPPHVITDEEGCFDIEGLRPGRWHLKIRAQGYCPAHRDVRVRDGEVTDVVIRLKEFVPPAPGSVVGLVTDRATGEPIVGVQVCYTPAYDGDIFFDCYNSTNGIELKDDESLTTSPPIIQTCVETNESGFFEINELNPIHYVLEFQTEGYYPFHKVVRVPSSDTLVCDVALISVETSGVLVGRVVNARNEEPIAGAHVVVTNNGIGFDPEDGTALSADGGPSILLGEAYTDEKRFLSHC